MAHKGKAMPDISFNLNNPPEAYTNMSIYDYVSDYMLLTRSIRGQDYDLSTNDIDGETVMRIGEARSMGDTGLVTVSLTHPLLPDSPRSKHGTRACAQARPYTYDRTLHNNRLMHSRLFKFYSSYIDLYTTLLPLQYCNTSFVLL